MLTREAPEIEEFFHNKGGTFFHRKIARTDRFSAHSFGIAIDLNTKKANHWRWSGVENYLNQVPEEIVHTFEAHGFIWGGRWFHFGTMHFEYRPELFDPECRLGETEESEP